MATSLPPVPKPKQGSAPATNPPSRDTYYVVDGVVVRNLEAAVAYKQDSRRL